MRVREPALQRRGRGLPLHCTACTANKLLSCLRAGGDAGVQFCSADGHPGDGGAEGEDEAVEVGAAVMWCC